MVMTFFRDAATCSIRISLSNEISGCYRKVVKTGEIPSRASSVEEDKDGLDSVKTSREAYTTHRTIILVAGRNGKCLNSHLLSFGRLSEPYAT
jgi:hypothetical protein